MYYLIESSLLYDFIIAFEDAERCFHDVANIITNSFKLFLDIDKIDIKYDKK